MKFARIKSCGKPAFSLLAALVASSTLALSHAGAEVLEMKWQAGQQLSYDVKMDGTMRFMAPADIPMIGGLPLEVLLKGEGQSTLDTREVDEFGSAIVVPRLERLQLRMNETTFNQTGVLGIRDGRGNFTFNGKSAASNVDVSRVTDPEHGLRITRQMRVVGVQPLPRREEVEPNENPPATNNPFPPNLPMILQAMITRAIPPFLPDGDVNVGDSWEALIEWPAIPGQVDAAKEAPGKFEFKALGQEEVLGRQTWHIAVDGAVQIRDISTAAANQTIEQRRAQGAKIPAVRLPNLLDMTQNVTGDVWFDPAAGQLVRAALRLDSQAEGRANATSRTDGNMNFNGTLFLELRKISFSGGE